MGGSMITNTHETTMNSIALAQFAKDKVVTQYTTELIGYSEAAENRVPVWEHDSKNAQHAANQFQYPKITRELFDKLKGTP